MSAANTQNRGQASASADGHKLARARREALSRGGKAGVGQAARSPAPTRGRAPARVEPAPQTAPRAPDPVRVEPPVQANGGTQPAEDNAHACDCTHEAEKQVLETVCSLVDADPSSPPSVRQLCQERRRALSSKGRTAQRNASPRPNGARRNGDARGMASNLRGREAAKARREVLCHNGRGNDPACRPSGRVRAAKVPTKVEIGNTLSGTPVTGNQVDRSNKMTGVPGTCRTITGTEYIGAEQFSQLCSITPEPAPTKVGVGSTARNQRVSGTQVGRSPRVTGDEHGECKNVTGDEYLNAEQFESFCGTKPAAAPASIGTAVTQGGQRVSGTEVGRSPKVTGDEPGACAKLTGAQYYQPDPSGNVCRGSGVPHKVSVMSTVRERPVTGTDVAPSQVVTGSEYGACKTVTGTEYAGLQQYQACNREPVLTPEKVTLMRTWRDLPVSGTSVEPNPKVTGDEYGACQPVSGTGYVGPTAYADVCPADRVTASKERVPTPHGAAGAAMTGVKQVAQDKITGSVRGRTRLSGTPYSDDPQYAPAGPVANQHHLSRGPADRTPASTSGEEVRPQRNFSVMSPARSAQESRLSRITGTAYGAAGRITGPVNLAAGLVSGTPEFRYREDNEPVAPVEQAAPPTRRVTGEGREEGFAITGAAWQRGGSITGTEGTSATRRNPTIRGDQRSMAMQLVAREREHPTVPPSRVTGSSGNTSAGSTITYSGGARG